MYKKVYVVMFLLIVLSLNGCKLDETNYNFDLSSDIESYSLTMSSVPGMPIDIKGSMSENVRIILNSEEGIFIKWDLTTGSVDIGNNKMVIATLDALVYWSPANTNLENISIDVIVQRIDEEKVTLLEERVYTIKNVNGIDFKLLNEFVLNSKK